MDVPEDPFARFRDLFERASSSEEGDPSSVALATTDLLGWPSVRIVLLKGLDDRGFVFYTNYDSRKGREIETNPRAALCFHWPGVQAQVRVEGEAERVTAEESDAYFASRPRGHQLAAWASTQSAALSSREELMRRYRTAEARFARTEVTRPPSWGGFRLVPQRIEFWHGCENRLHDRILYTRFGSGWATERLYP